MSEVVLQDLIVRMASDAAFADEVRANPGALSAYDLTPDEVSQLTSLSADSGAGAAGLGTRESKSSMFFMGGGGHHDVSSGIGGHTSHVDLGGHAPGQHIDTGHVAHVTPGGDHSAHAPAGDHGKFDPAVKIDHPDKLATHAVDQQHKGGGEFGLKLDGHKDHGPGGAHEVRHDPGHKVLIGLNEPHKGDDFALKLEGHKDTGPGGAQAGHDQGHKVLIGLNQPHKGDDFALKLEGHKGHDAAVPAVQHGGSVHDALPSDKMFVDAKPGEHHAPAGTGEHLKMGSEHLKMGSEHLKIGDVKLGLGDVKLGDVKLGLDGNLDSGMKI